MPNAKNSITSKQWNCANVRASINSCVIGKINMPINSSPMMMHLYIGHIFGLKKKSRIMQTFELDLALTFLH